MPAAADPGLLRQWVAWAAWTRKALARFFGDKLIFRLYQMEEALQWCYYHLPDDGPLQDTLLLCDCVRTILSTHSQRYPDTYARSTVGERRRGCWLPLSEATKLNFETLLDSLRVFLSLTERASFGGVSRQRLGAGWLWQFARAVVGSELRPQLHTGELEPWHLR